MWAMPVEGRSFEVLWNVQLGLWGRQSDVLNTRNQKFYDEVEAH
jgi:hypothetical protein